MIEISLISIWGDCLSAEVRITFKSGSESSGIVPAIEGAPPLWAWSKQGTKTLTANRLIRLRKMAEKIIYAKSNFKG